MNTKYKSSLLCRPEEDALARRDVLVHEPRVLEAVRQAVEKGLTPSGFDVAGDAVTARDLVREVRHAHPELVDELW